MEQNYLWLNSLDAIAQLKSVRSWIAYSLTKFVVHLKSLGGHLKRYHYRRFGSWIDVNPLKGNQFLFQFRGWFVGGHVVWGNEVCHDNFVTRNITNIRYSDRQNNLATRIARTRGDALGIDESS